MLLLLLLVVVVVILITIHIITNMIDNIINYVGVSLQVCLAQCGSAGVSLQAHQIAVQVCHCRCVIAVQLKAVAGVSLQVCLASQKARPSQHLFKHAPDKQITPD